MSTNPSPLYPELLATVQNLSLGRISPGRGKILDGLAAYIQAKVSDHQPVRLSFICTHNSRRSHFSQVWAQALAHYFNIGKVSCYSGGTEATALFPTVAETLAKQGFRIQQLSTGGNPVLAIKFADDEPAVIGFSKTLDDAFNPRSGFAAIM